MMGEHEAVVIASSVNRTSGALAGPSNTWESKTMKHNLRITTGLVLLTAFATVAMAPLASIASTAGRRNTAIGLTAGAIYAIASHKTGAAVVLGGGAAYAWKRHNDARKQQAYARAYSARGSHRVYYRKNGRLHYYTVRR